jgi:hypothetical protein
MKIIINILINHLNLLADHQQAPSHPAALRQFPFHPYDGQYHSSPNYTDAGTYLHQDFCSFDSS